MANGRNRKQPAAKRAASPPIANTPVAQDINARFDALSLRLAILLHEMKTDLARSRKETDRLVGKV